jgi:hypothetical protein
LKLSKGPEQAGFLAETADAIRALGRNAVRDIIKIGWYLSEAKERAGHGNWLQWLRLEFAWSERTAQRFMDVYRLSLKSDKLADLEIDLSVLYLLASKSMPEPVREEIFDRAAAGEVISLAAVRETRAATQVRLNVETPLTPDPAQYLKISQTRRVLDALRVLGAEGPKCDLDNALIGELRALPEICAALKFAARIETAISQGFDGGPATRH